MLKWLKKKSKGKAVNAAWLSEYPVEPKLLKQALTHKSAEEGPDNERLEFLGDAVLELIITEELYRSFPNHTEGQLTKARVGAVSEPSLAEAASQLGLGKQLRMSRGEEVSGGRERPSILSDAFEAVVAAVYLSLGMDAARKFILEHLGETLGVARERDFKSRLQEYTQEHFRATPTYRTAEEIGPAHDRKFVAEVILAGDVLRQGTGRSKKIAEQAAAQEALDALTQGRLSCPTPPPSDTPSAPRTK